MKKTDYIFTEQIGFANCMGYLRDAITIYFEMIERANSVTRIALYPMAEIAKDKKCCEATARKYVKRIVDYGCVEQVAPGQWRILDVPYIRIPWFGQVVEE